MIKNNNWKKYDSITNKVWLNNNELNNNWSMIK